MILNANTTPKPPEKTAAEDFVNKAANTAVRQVRKPKKLVSLADARIGFLSTLLFGNTGKGKTHTAFQLLKGGAGLKPRKLLYINTDIGVGGANTITGHLRKEGLSALLNRVETIQVSQYEEIEEFLSDPWAYETSSGKPIAEWLLDDEAGTLAKPTCFWDGFSAFQIGDIAEYVLENSTAVDESDLRAAGLIFDKVGKDPGWEARKRATIRSIDKFVSLRLPGGQPLHKVATCNETVQQKPGDPKNPTAESVVQETYKLLLSGAAGTLLKGAFDIILRCSVGQKEGKPWYYYAVHGTENQDSKVRVLSLENKINADICALWAQMMDAYGVQDGI